MFDKWKKKIEDKKNPSYSKTITKVAQHIDRRNIKALEEISTNRSLKRLGITKYETKEIMTSFVKVMMKNSKFIEIADVYVTQNNLIIGSGFYWIYEDYTKHARSKFNLYDLAKKDIGVFLLEDNKVKFEFDGLISLSSNKQEIDTFDEEINIFVDVIMNYYNQKIFRIIVLNKTNYKIFFRKNVDTARVRIYFDGIYEEKIIYDEKSPSLVYLNHLSEHLIESQTNMENEILGIELFNLYVEKDIGKYEKKNFMIMTDNKFAKNDIDRQVKSIKENIDKISQCKSLEDFYKIIDLETMKKYYSEFVREKGIDYKELEEKILSIHMSILQGYRYIDINKIIFDDNIYKLKLNVEERGKEGFIELNINKLNNKFVFLNEYIISLKKNLFVNLEIETDKILKKSVDIAFCKKSKLLIIKARAKEKYLSKMNYLKVNIETDNGVFVEYLRFGKLCDVNFENTIDAIESENDVKKWLMEEGFAVTLVRLSEAKEVKSIKITDNTSLMEELRDEFLGYKSI